MKKKKVNLFITCSALILLGATAWFTVGADYKTSTLSPREYTLWVENEENGLKVSKEILNYTVTAQYKPVEYVVAMEEKTQRLTTQVLEKRNNELGDMQYFTLRIEKINKQGDVLMEGTISEEDYYARVGYLSLEMQNDIYLVENGDTLPCRLFNFVRNYALAPYADFVLAFDKGRRNNCDKQFVYDDNVFGLGKINLLIRKEDLEKAPKLKIY